MPEHPHLIAPARDASEACRRFANVLSGLRRSKEGCRTRWQPVPTPAEIADRTKLERSVRYVALNPCRERLCHDPLAWIWSTHRDVVGATIDAWPQAGELARRLGRDPNGFARRHHRYVSSDPSVAPGGTPFPEPARRCDAPVHGLGVIAEAAACAARSSADPAQLPLAARTQFLQLAHACGWRDVGAMARFAALSTSGVRFNLRRVACDISPGLQCLGDGRLRTAAVALRAPAGVLMAV